MLAACPDRLSGVLPRGQHMPSPFNPESCNSLSKTWVQPVSCSQYPCDHHALPFRQLGLSRTQYADHFGDFSDLCGADAQMASALFMRGETRDCTSLLRGYTWACRQATR